MSELSLPCRVCNGPGKGVHYGVNTCDACKGFFHRSLQLSGKYKCAADRSYLVQYGKGMMCRLCRFKKCLAMGMAKEAIKTGRYTSKKKNEDIIEVKRLKTANKSHLNLQPNQIFSLTSKTSNHSDERKTTLRSSQLDDINAKRTENVTAELSSMSASFSTQEKFVSSSTVSLSPMAQPWDCSLPVHLVCSRYPVHSSCSGSNLSDSGSLQRNPSSLDSPSSQSSLPTSPNEKGFNCAHNGSRSNISKEYVTELYADKDAVLKTLLAANLSAFSYIYDHWSIETSKEETQKHYELCKVHSELFERKNMPPNDESYSSLFTETDLGRDLHHSVVSKYFGDSEHFLRKMIQFIRNVPGFQSLSMDDRIKLVKSGRFEFGLIMIHQYCNTDLGVIRYSNTDYICHRDIANFNLKKMLDVFDDHVEGCKRLQALNLRFEERVVLLAMSIMAPDRIELTETKYEIINEIYWNLAQILLDLLDKRLDKPYRMFAKLVDISTWYRECEVKTKAWMKETYLGPYILQELPLTKEIIQDDNLHDMDSKD